MVKKLTLAGLALAVLATVAVSPAMAANPFRVEVPFDFVVKGTTLSSGDYSVIVQDNGLVRVLSGNGDRAVTVFTSAVHDRQAQAVSQLIFAKTETGLVLTQVRVPTSRGGLEIVSSRSGKRTASAGDDGEAVAIVVFAKDETES